MCAAQCCQSDTWNQPSRDKWVNPCQLRWMTNAVTDPQGMEAGGDPYWPSQTCSILIPFVQLSVGGPLVPAAPSQQLWAACLEKCCCQVMINSRARGFFYACHQPLTTSFFLLVALRSQPVTTGYFAGEHNPESY